MELIANNGRSFSIREYTEKDFKEIHGLNISEGWSNLVEKQGDAKQAWNHSNIKFVVLDKENYVGYIRGITDHFITLYICELLISKNYRGLGIGQEVLKYVHRLYPKTRMEMLAASTSHTFYEQLDFRSFYGFRKTYNH